MRAISGAENSLSRNINQTAYIRSPVSRQNVQWNTKISEPQMLLHQVFLFEHIIRCLDIIQLHKNIPDIIYL